MSRRNIYYNHEHTFQNHGFEYTNKLFGNRNSASFFKVIEEHLPPVFTRRTASLSIGGLISPKTMSNLDSLGKGPLVKVRVGGKVGYERDSFMIWLKQKLK